MRLRGTVWIRLLLVLVRLRLYVPFVRLLRALRLDPDLLVECGDHDGLLTWRDLPWLDERGTTTRPRFADD